MKVECSVCGRKIPKARLDALPDTKVCIKCSHVQPKTIADVDVDGPDNEDLIHSAQASQRDK